MLYPNSLPEVENEPCMNAMENEKQEKQNEFELSMQIVLYDIYVRIISHAVLKRIILILRRRHHNGSNGFAKIGESGYLEKIVSGRNDERIRCPIDVFQSDSTRNRLIWAWSCCWFLPMLSSKTWYQQVQLIIKIKLLTVLLSCAICQRTLGWLIVLLKEIHPEFVLHNDRQQCGWACSRWVQGPAISSCARPHWHG